MDLITFVREVRRIDTAQCAPKTLSSILASVHVETRDLSALPWREQGYTRTCLYRDDSMEILLLRWSPAAQTPIHDHASQRCWFTTLRGSFDLTNYRRIAGGRAAGYARIEAVDVANGVGIGEPDYRGGDAEIHRVQVHSPEEAVSLHVYAKPLATCLVFNPEAQRCSIKRMSYDALWTDKIVLASA